MAIRLAQAFVIASLILLLVYGADTGSSTSTMEKTGFLPMDTMTRGIVFGGGAVVLSTAAFFVSLNERSTFVSVLLIINGILMATGGIVVLGNRPMIGTESVGGYIVLGLGLWVIALGIVKLVRRKKETAAVKPV
jgi:hypothetical protein